MDAPRNTEGARAVGAGDGGRKRRAGWLLPLLALLALLVVGGVLLASLGGDGDDGQGAAATQTTGEGATQGSSAGEGETGGGGEAGGTGAEAGGTGGAAAGGEATLTAGGTSLLPAPDDVQGLIGQGAQGTGLRVVSVTEQGFFVGTGSGADDERVYVELGGEVGEDEQAQRPAEGDVVQLSGPVRPAPQDPGRTLRLEQADSELVEQQGFFVNAEDVQAQGS